jgi:hypothetical protein
MKTKSIIAALLLAASSAFAQVPSYVPTNGLVGWWPFNGNANDESGNGNNGTVNGATLATDRLGNVNKAYSFDGVNNKIEVPNSTILNFGVNPTFSINFWINKNTATAGGIISKAIPLNGFSWVGFNFVFDDFQIGYPCLSNIINTGTNSWNCLTFTIQNGLIKGFLNGVLINQFTCNQIVSNSISNTNNLYFGVDRDGNNYYNGLIDDIGIWNRALTQQEITNLYYAQSCISNTITADGPTAFCAGNSVNLKSDVVGGTYQWRRNGVNISTNATSRTFKASLTGTYTCIATCNGTTLTSNAIAVTSKTNAAATVSASGATSFCAGDSVTLNATNLGSNYSVQWYRTNVSMENATNYSQVVKQPGTYKVVTRNLTNGCSRISGSAITTNVNCRIANNNQSEPTSNDINEEAKTLAPELSQGVNLFPNPNNGSFKFTYEGEGEGEGTIQVISAMGQVIYQSQATAEDGRISKEIFLGDQYQKGIYIVRLLINGGQNDSRMIVQ